MAAADVGIAGKSVSDQNRIGSIGIENAGSFVTDVDIFKLSAAIQRQRSFQLVVTGNCDKDPVFVQFSFDFITSKV